ncbi:hypothetical protein HHI36_005004, partial [Cryptolaemus montrouzieri]
MQALPKLYGADNKVTLVWVLGHIGEHDIEIADQLLFQNAIKLRLLEIGDARKNFKPGRILWTEKMENKLLSCSTASVKTLFLLNRKEYSMVTDFFRTNYLANYHLNSPGLSDEGNFCLGNEPIRTAEHAL